MYLTKITARNFMAGNFDHKLAQFNIVSGDNMSGKTRLSRAVQYALGGFVPIKGARTAGDILENLGNGNPLSVVAEFVGEQAVSRSVSKQKRSTATEAKWKGLPPDWAAPAMMLDAREYLDKTGRERTQIVFNACDTSKAAFDVNELTASVKNLKLAENTPESEAALADLVEIITVGHQAALRDGEPLQVWLASLVAELEKKQSEANAAVKRMDGTVKGLIELKTQSNAPEIPASLEGELRSARSQASTAQANVNTIENEKTTAGAKRARKVEIETALARPDTQGDEITAKEKERKKLNDEIDSFLSETPKISKSHLAATKKAAEIKTMVKGIEDQLADLDVKRLKILECVDCPTCLASDESWRPRYEKNFSKERGVLEKRLANLNGDLDLANKNLAAEKKKLDEAVKEDGLIQKKRERVTELQTQIADLQRVAGAVSRMRGELAGLGDVTDESILEQRLQSAKQSRDTINATVTRLETEYNKLVAQRASLQAQASAIEEGKKNMAELEVTKKSLIVVTETLQAITKATIEPLLARANALAAPILDRALVYHEGEIGYMVAGRFQSHHTFCGVEEALTFAALSIALAAQSEIKIVFIDEMGIFSAKRKAKLVVLMLDLIERKAIDQFIGNDAVADGYATILGENEYSRVNFVKL